MRLIDNHGRIGKVRAAAWLLCGAWLVLLGACGGGGYSGGSQGSMGTSAPTITTQPQSVSVSAGSKASFTVMATGYAPITYQWMRNSTAIAGATGATYTTPATLVGDSGTTFAVQLKNAYGSVTSSPAMLTVM
jgi:hypothetical protein